MGFVLLPQRRNCFRFSIFTVYSSIGINCKCFCVFSSTNITDCHDIPEILLKVALNNITPTLTLNSRLDEVPLERLHIGHYNILTLQFLKTSLSGFDFYQLQYRLSTCGYTEGIYSWEMYSCFIITHDMHDPMFQIGNILICWKLEQYFYLLLTSGMVYSINQLQQQQWYPNWKFKEAHRYFILYQAPSTSIETISSVSVQRSCH